MNERHNARRHLGFTLVELMVSLALGTFVVLGALGATTGMLRGDTIAATRLDQELRNAAFVLERETMRAGFTGAAAQALAAGAERYTNPFALLDVSTPGCIRFAYDANKNGVLDTAAGEDERYALALEDGVLHLRIGGEAHDCNPQAGDWEPLTDGALVRIEDFTLELSSLDTPVRGSTRALLQRTVHYTITGVLVRDARRTQTLQGAFALPNLVAN